MTHVSSRPHSNRQLCALSVDVDPLTAYYTIHGLGAPPKQVHQTILRKALPRFEQLFAELDVPATFFVVGRDLEQSDEAQTVLQRLCQAGHELANHTYSHPYELCRLSRDAVAEEVERGHAAIVQTLGDSCAPVGFRSPGYFVNGTVLQVLIEQGYRYDSSMFPSPPYYLAKAAVMLGLAVRGRRSGAVLADPRGLTAPPTPIAPTRASHGAVVQRRSSSCPWRCCPTRDCRRSAQPSPSVRQPCATACSTPCAGVHCST